MVDVQPKGMDVAVVNPFRVVCFLAVAAAASGDSYAQRFNEDREELNIGVNVGYNTWFRDGTWVPVEVLISNEQRDFDGYVEIRAYDYSDRLQSPVYRMPAQCPQNSRKRFVVNAFLDGTQRVEAWLYEGNRVAIDVPSYVQTQPIDPEDLLTIVLDDEPENLGFLYAAVQRDDRAVRYHRFALPTSDTGRLPDVAQAYRAFNAVILGDFEPDRVATRHRRLIREYVESGGVVVVLTGLRSADYRDTWVEDLAGVRIGETDVMNGYDLAAATLPEIHRAGARADRECVVATLMPISEGVRTTGGERILATERTLGSGRVFTLAIDATSHALQDTSGYRLLWREMIAASNQGPPLNTDMFASTLSNVLPSLSGVTIRPLRWVMVYLLLYVGIGVVGNWFFWNARGRREMAWLCLLVFSVGFSAFAMMSGRAGWSSSAELQQVDVLHLRPNEERADYIGMYGILTARTRQYDAELSSASLLVRDGLTMSTDMLRTMGIRGARSQAVPFRWVQGENARLERIRVGASELRLLQIEGRVPVDGRVEHDVVADADGIRGTIWNGTDLALETAAIYYRGVFVPLTRTETGWSIDQSQESISNRINPNVQYQYMGYPGWGESIESMRDSVRYALFSDEDMGLISYPQPYFVGWTSGTQRAALEMDEVLESEIAETLVVAPLFSGDPSSIDPRLRVQTYSHQNRTAPQPHEGYAAFYPSLRLRVDTPPLRGSRQQGAVLLTVLARNAPDGHEMKLFRVDPDNPYATDFSDENAIEPDSRNRVEDDDDTYRFEYRIDDWTPLIVDARSNAITLDLAWVRDAATDDWNRRHGEAYARARFVPAEPSPTEGVWPKWQ